MIAVDMNDLRDDLSYFVHPREDYIDTGLWLNVNLWRSYFGVGYERGDVQLFVGLANWLESRLPNCDIFYGEDCTSILHPFPAEYRVKLLAYHDRICSLDWRSPDPVVKARLQEARIESGL